MTNCIAVPLFVICVILLCLKECRYPDDAGVEVALGNDAGTANVPFGWGMHHEMALYVEAGLTPMDAIVAATAAGAGRMPPEGEAGFGTLEAGKAADLVVLNADPLADIRNTLEIDRVMRLGEWVTVRDCRRRRSRAPPARPAAPGRQRESGSSALPGLHCPASKLVPTR